MPSFNTVKKLLKKHHKHVRNISDPAITGGIERESKAARRNAVDLGSRPRHNGTPLCLILEVIAIPRGIETENNRLHELIDSSYWDDGEEDARKTTCAYQYPAQLNGVLYDPFPKTQGHSAMFWLSCTARTLMSQDMRRQRGRGGNVRMGDAGAWGR